MYGVPDLILLMVHKETRRMGSSWIHVDTFLPLAALFEIHK